MVFRSAKDGRIVLRILIFTAVLIAAAAVAFTYLTGAARFILGGIDCALAFLLLWALFGTRYTFTDTALVLRCGPLSGTFPYPAIREVAKTTGRGFVMALARERLELNPSENENGAKTFLSPERREEFLKELRRRCPWVVITEEK